MSVKRVYTSLPQLQNHHKMLSHQMREQLIDYYPLAAGRTIFGYIQSIN